MLGGGLLFGGSHQSGTFQHKHYTTQYHTIQEFRPSITKDESLKT